MSRQSDYPFNPRLRGWRQRSAACALVLVLVLGGGCLGQFEGITILGVLVASGIMVVAFTLLHIILYCSADNAWHEARLAHESSVRQARKREQAWAEVATIMAAGDADRVRRLFLQTMQVDVQK